MTDKPRIRTAIEGVERDNRAATPPWLVAFFFGIALVIFVVLIAGIYFGGGFLQDQPSASINVDYIGDDEIRLTYISGQSTDAVYVRNHNGVVVDRLDSEGETVTIAYDSNEAVFDVTGESPTIYAVPVQLSEGEVVAEGSGETIHAETYA